MLFIDRLSFKTTSPTPTFNLIFDISNIKIILIERQLKSAFLYHLQYTTYSDIKFDRQNLI